MREWLMLRITSGSGCYRLTPAPLQQRKSSIPNLTLENGADAGEEDVRSLGETCVLYLALGDGTNASLAQTNALSLVVSIGAFSNRP
jgi:hypothetical protein